MISDQHWREVTHTLGDLHLQLQQIPAESDSYPKAQKFLPLVQGMLAEAFDMGSPLSRKSSVKAAPKGSVGRPRKDYRLALDDEQALSHLLDDLIRQYYHESNMWVDEVPYAPSRFFACLYAAFDEYELSKSRNLKGFCSYLDGLKPQLQADGYHFTLTYQAVDAEMKKWHQYIENPDHYTIYMVSEISAENIADKKLYRRFLTLRNLYDVVVGILRGRGFIPKKVVD